MPTPDWVTNESWEVLYLGGERLFGVARVDIKLPSGLDIQKPKGGRRATIKDEGTPPAVLDISIELLPIELALFELQIGLLRPRSKNGARDPIEIGHPNARLWGINVVTIGEIDSPQPRAGGTYVCSFTAHEWAPAPTKVKKSKKKPKDKAKEIEEWNVQKLIEEQRPARSTAASDNF